MAPVFPRRRVSIQSQDGKRTNWVKEHVAERMLEQNQAHLLDKSNPSLGLVAGPDPCRQPNPYLESSNSGVIERAAFAASCKTGCCEICGFSRFIELAHILPARFGFPAEPWNILELCPNHHRLFDRNILTADEFQIILPRFKATLPFLCFSQESKEWFEALTSRYGVIIENREYPSSRFERQKATPPHELQVRS